ncbi:hypothetical protein KR044_003409 [Drosophila immigrans]|nr:hypothetical protein KR044_003409 [Drosophila immigrans]
MKVFVLVAVCLLATSVSAADKDEKMLGSPYGGAGAPPAPPVAYGPPATVGVPAPPCPKNYLFSCQPNLTPVPCSAPAPSYGSAGAYSQYVPVYARPMQW